MPYLPTFQPQGVRRDRTEEFVANRRKRSEGKKLEEGRLCRRMEKVRRRLVRLRGARVELTDDGSS